MSKALGIIGGMGPLATSYFFQRIILSTDANSDQEHINIFISNHASLPDRTKSILTNKKIEFLDEIKRDIEWLEYTNVSNIAIPCNTAHYFYSEIQGYTSIPIINMIKETILLAKNIFGGKVKVGLLATIGTLKTGIYQKYADKHNVDIELPDEKSQNNIMNVIYKIKRDPGNTEYYIEQEILQLINKNKCDCVVLACTELSCLKKSEVFKKYTIDAMDVLTIKSILYSGKNIKPNKIHIIDDEGSI